MCSVYLNRRRFNKNSLTWWYVLKSSWRHFENVLARGLEGVLNTSVKMFWKRLNNVFKTFVQDVLKTSWRCLEDVWPRLQYWSWPWGLEDVFNKSSEDVQLRRIYSSWSRCLEGVLKMYSEDEDKDVCKTSSRRFHQDKYVLGTL